MRIATIIFSQFPNGGAVAHRVFSFSKGLVSLGHEAHILSPYKVTPGPLNERIGGVSIHWAAHLRERNERNILSIINKRHLLFKKCYDLMKEGLDWLILYDMGLDGLPFLILSKSYGVKVATDNCDIRWISDKPELRELIYIVWYTLGNLFIIPYTNVNFAISRQIKQRLGKIAPNVPTVILPAPVDFERFRSKHEGVALFKKKYGILEGKVIGYFGSQWAVKGLEVLLQAISRLKNIDEKIQLLITGDAANNRYLLELINKIGIKDQVILTGFLSDDDLITAMSVSDIFVEPKIAHKANQASFPQKLVEYLAMGKPIVASDVGDIGIYLKDGENALLCPPGNSNSISRAISKLIRDKSLCNKLSQKGKETAARFFDSRLLSKEIVRSFSM